MDWYVVLLKFEIYLVYFFLQTLQVLDESTEIGYTIANEAAGGIVSARDFVNVRHWIEKDGIYYICLSAVNFEEMPEQKKYVR